MPFCPRPRYTWTLPTRTLALGDRTLVMAIVNLTPDSFSGDGLYARDAGSAVNTALAALDDGADILDLGAESTRPGSQPLSSEDERQRLLPVLSAVRHARPAAVISVDTYHAATAAAALDHGADIVNDVSGLTWDPAMASTVATRRCGFVLMHTHGRPQTWPTDARLGAGRVVDAVIQGWSAQLATANIERDRIVLDPGFGFGKRGADENFALLAGMERFAALGYPLLVGVSRKGFLGEAVAGLHPAGTPLADARRQATTAAQTAAILAGAHIIRSHDVIAAREAATVADRCLAALS